MPPFYASNDPIAVVPDRIVQIGHHSPFSDSGIETIYQNDKVQLSVSMSKRNPANRSQSTAPFLLFEQRWHFFRPFWLGLAHKPIPDLPGFFGPVVTGEWR